jgi:hypothetical protein
MVTNTIMNERENRNMLIDKNTQDSWPMKYGILEKPTYTMSIIPNTQLNICAGWNGHLNPWDRPRLGNLGNRSSSLSWSESTSSSDYLRPIYDRPSSIIIDFLSLLERESIRDGALVSNAIALSTLFWAFFSAKSVLNWSYWLVFLFSSS